MKNAEHYSMYKKCPRCVSSCVYKLSPFLVSHFLGKQKCFHTSDLKLSEAFTLSQTLSFGSPLQLDAYTTFALLLDLSRQVSCLEDLASEAVICLQ